MRELVFHRLVRCWCCTQSHTLVSSAMLDWGGLLGGVVSRTAGEDRIERIDIALRMIVDVASGRKGGTVKCERAFPPMLSLMLAAIFVLIICSTPPLPSLKAGLVAIVLPGASYVTRESLCVHWFSASTLLSALQRCCYDQY